jgi:hypothetical protein
MPVEINVTEDSGSESESVVIEAGSLNSLATDAIQPAMVSNVSSSNVVSNINRSTQNAVSNQFAVSQLSVSIVGKALSLIGTVQPMEAKSAQNVLSGSSLAESIASLKAATEKLDPSNHAHDHREHIIEVIPDPIPSGLVYANMPLFLAYDNPDGIIHPLHWEIEALLRKR